MCFTYLFFTKNPECLLLPAFQVLQTHVINVIFSHDGETGVVFVKYIVGLEPSNLCKPKIKWFIAVPVIGKQLLQVFSIYWDRGENAFAKLILMYLC